MARIRYVKGDATKPLGDGEKYIVHICNDIGGWGAGFVLALSNRWEGPEEMYRKWYGYGYIFELGRIQRVKVEDDITVINMIDQHRTGYTKGEPPIRYNALHTCLCKVGRAANDSGASVHMPRIGCGLAGGQWDIVEKIIKETLTDNGIEVTVYDFD